MVLLEMLYMAMAVLVLALLVWLWLTSDCDPWLRAAVALDWGGQRLRGRVVWLTGASSGIGEALAVQLSRRGARLVLTARRDDQLQRVRSRCLQETGAAPEDVLVLPLDVTALEQHADALQRVIDTYGRLDVLVHNAGRSQRADWLLTELEVDRQLFELDVFAPVHLTRLAVPRMLEGGGAAHVVVMSSTAGTVPAAFSCSYTAAKHALHGYFDTLRQEMVGRGVTVTLLCPGPTFSDLLRSAFVERAGHMYDGSMAPDDRRMSADRCAILCAAAIAARLPEAWIALQPVISLQYFARYCPYLMMAVISRLGPNFIMKLRDSRPRLQKQHEQLKTE